MSVTQKSSTYEVVMPRLGLTMTEGKIIEWFKNNDELVEKGEPLFSIENEKATLEIEAPASGVVRILVSVDTVVPILKPVALIMKEGSGFVQPVVQDSLKPDITPVQPIQIASSKEFIDSDETGTIKASPRARNLAMLKKINLSTIIGSGVRGMIITRDVEKFEAESTAIKATPLARRKAAEAGIDLKKVTGSGPS
jgi:pyruvate dehydrogenase E2 component (dihydrolipoamide acetyltransferase)